MPDVTIPDSPQTRTEQYLAAANGQSVTLPTPKTREEIYLNEIATKMQGGGSSVTVEPLSVTQNGTYTAPSGKAYSPVTVAVPEGIPITLTNHVNPITGKWERPANYPDLDSITLPEDFDGVYLTYDLTKTPDYGWIGIFVSTANSAAWTVERGHIENGSFATDYSTQMSNATYFRQPLDDVNGDVQLWRITSADHITEFGFVANTETNANNITNNLQPCVEEYGKLNYQTSFVNVVSTRSNYKAYTTVWMERLAIELGKYANVTNLGLKDSYSLQEVTSGNWKTGSCTSFSQLFDSAGLLQILDTSTWDTHSVTNIYAAFRGCVMLKSLDVSGWDTGAVTNAQYAFENCRSLSYLDVSNWDTSKFGLGNSDSMFNGCWSLKSLDVSEWNTSNFTNTKNMFSECFSLDALDVSAWDTEKITNMSNMFLRCYSIRLLDLHGWDVSSVTNMQSMFELCDSLEELNISGWTPTAVTSCYRMMSGITNLRKINANGVTLSITSGLPEFNIRRLTDYWPVIIGENQTFDSANLLTRASLLRIIDSLPEVSSTKTLTLGQSNTNKLTAAEIAVATGKGWTVA